MTLSGRCATLCTGLVLAFGAWTAPAIAQQPKYTYPFDVKQSPIISPAPIDSWVETQAKDLNSADREKVVAARQALLLPGTDNDKSAAFLDVYSKALARSLAPVVNGSDAHAKLNAAMVVGRVTEIGGTPDLVPLIEKLIGDDSIPVSLYGIRAASGLIPRVLGDKNLAANDKLVPAIGKALGKHVESEAIAAESYLALIRVVNTPNLVQQVPANMIAEATPRIAISLIDLLNIRAKQFGTGTVVEPMAESPAIVFLAKQSTWAAMNNKTQATAVKEMLEIAVGAAKEVEIEFSKTPSRNRVASLQRLLKDSIGQALIVVGNVLKDPALVAEADKLKPLNSLSKVSEWHQAVDGIVTAYSKAFQITVEKPAAKPAQAADKPAAAGN